MVARQGTNLGHAEIVPYAHKYLLKRPRTHEHHELADRVINLHGSEEEESAKIDNPLVEKRRFELFIDLIWVGIIGNLAETFSDEAFGPEAEDVGYAVWHFIILFLMAWRFWKYLQEFMAKYATNDMVERAFVVWALILAMLWGNNAPYLFNQEAQSNLTISIYLVWRGSVMLCEAYYALFIRHIRSRISFHALFIIPSLPLWIAAYYFTIDVKAGLAFAAVNVENLSQFIIDTPFITNRFIHEKDRGDRFNVGHWVERTNDFYIIILGEGVLSLIRGSPLEEGISRRAGGGALALIAYYVLSGFYFNGDQSKRYIHAVRRTWWRNTLWQSCHNVLFGATLILGVSVVFLLQHPIDNAITPPENDFATREEGDSAAHLALAIYAAKWTVSVSLALALINQTLIALLNRSMDPPGSLKINNRLLRLLPRILLVPIILCLPIDREMLCLTYLGTVSTLLAACLPWEWWSSLDRDGGFIET